jgi:hypothetical protein
MHRTAAAALVALALTVAGSSAATAVPIDPSPTHPARTWHQTRHPARTWHVARTWHPKPCQTWPRPTGCPTR